MKRSDLIAAIAAESGCSKKDVDAMLEAFCSVATNALRQRDPIVLKGFGTLSPREQNSRPARNPKTGEVVIIPKRLSVKFSVGTSNCYRWAMESRRTSIPSGPILNSKSTILKLGRNPNLSRNT